MTVLAAGRAERGATVESRVDAWRLALAVVTAGAIVRLALAATVPLVPDETYYWDWSRRLALSYFDHPPAVAVFARIGTIFFGATPLGVRAASVVAGWGVTVAVIALARRLGGGAAALRAAIIVSCLPLVAIGLVIASPDVPLLLFAALTLLAVDRAISLDARSGAALGWWLLAGVACGLAFVSKYTAVLLPGGIFIALLLGGPVLRRHLAAPGPWVAAVIAALLSAPVVIWNAHHGWASFRFQLAHGLGTPHGSHLEREANLFGGQLALVSPILFVMLAIAVVRGVQTLGDRSRVLLGAIALAVFVFFMTSALRSPVEANWPAPAYLAAIPLLAALPLGRLGRRWLIAGCALGGAMVLVLYVQSVSPVFPLSADDDRTSDGAGWDVLAHRVEAARAALPRGHTTWVAGERYQEASALAFHLHDHPTTFSIGFRDRPNEYRFRPPFRALAEPGDNLLLVLGAMDTTARILAPDFTSVRLVERVQPVRGHEPLRTRWIWALEGWRGTWPVRTLPP